jgi:hypothetical protein
VAGHDADASRRRDRLVVVGVVLLSALLLGPALAPGYVLQNDLVFVPTQDLLPWMLGLTGGLPRSVPQDAVVALLSGPVPGWLLEKAALLGALVLLGTGCARLARPRGTTASVVAAVAATWSAYVGERLLLGHWSLLLAVGALPWALHLARRARTGHPGAGARWLLLVALASLTVTGGVLVLLCTAPVVLVRASRVPRARRLLLALGATALQLPWAVPALLHPSSAAAGGADVFAARAEGPWGLLLTVLTGGGAWNASAVPASRTTWFAVVLGLVVLAVAAVGAHDLVPVLGRAAALTLSVAAALGLLWCLLGGWTVTRPWVAWVVAEVPGAGVLRDAQKWLAPWVVLVAVAAGLGAARLCRGLVRSSGDRSAGAALAVALVALPVLGLPSLAWGELGRLSPVSYPDDLSRVRQAIAASGDGRDAVSLPWSTFRRFPWNPGRTVLDPVPRAMPVTVVASDSLVVATPHGLVTVAGDDPAAAHVQEALDAQRPLGPVLESLGVGWAVVADDLPDARADLPVGAVPVVRGTSFSLFRLVGTTEPTGRSATLTVLLVVTGDATALAVLAAALGITIRTRLRRGGADGATGW